MRKLLIALVLLLIIALAGYLIYSMDENITKNKSSKGISAIPYNSAAILRVNEPVEKWSELIASPYGRQLSLISPVNVLDKSILKIQERILEHPVLNNCYKNGDIYLSLHMTGVQSFNYLIIGNCKQEQKAAFITALEKSLESTKTSQRIYEECQLTKVSYNDNKANLSVAFEEGLVILSSSPILLENSVLQLKRRIPLNEKPEFKRLFKTADKAIDANLFVNYSEFGHFLDVFSSSEKTESLRHFGDWMEVDLNLNDKGLMFNGFSLLKDSSATFLSNLKNLSPGKMNVASVVPDNAAYFSFLGFEDFKEYHNNFKEHLQQKQELYQFEKNISNINKNNDIDIAEDLYAWIGNEFCFFMTQGEHENPMQNACVAIHSNNVELSLEKLHKIGSKHDANKDTISFMNYPIHNLGLVNFLPLTLGDFFKGVKHTHYVVLQDYIVFGNDVGNLKNVINSYLRGKTLIKNIDFNQFYENFKEESSYFVYLNPKRAKNFWSYFLDEKTAKLFNDHQEFLNDFEAIGFQSIAHDNLFYTNAYSNYKVIKNDQAISLIECVLDTSYSRKPWLVKNHYTQENELLLQDDNNQLYLINNVGKILWRKQLDQKIVGDIHLIDRYKNKKYQYLFGTGNELYLIDRNGNKVDGFPLKLKHKQTLGISVLDYDKNRNYRILVPCGNKIITYAADGKQVKGWKFNNAKGQLSSSPSLLQVGKKDYVIFSDNQGNVYATNRKGNTRIEINSQLPKNRSSYEILIKNNLKNSGVLTTDTNGIVYFLKLSDEIETITTRAFSKFHDFSLDHLASPSVPDVLYYDEHEIYAYKLSKNNLFSIKDLDYTPSFGVQAHTLDDDGNYIITTTSRENNQVFAYDSNGELLENFPMEANSDVLVEDLNKDGQKELIIGTKSGSLFIYSIF